MNTRGVSPVIATVLIILVTILAAGILAPFVINFTEKNLDESGSCFDILGELAFAETKFNCNYGGHTGFSVQVKSDAITSFKVSLTATGASDVIEIVNGTNPTGSPDVRMLQDFFATSTLLMPQKGGTRTYVAQGAYDSAEVSAVLADGQVCGTSDTIIFNPCSDPEAQDLVDNG